jgi:hypothetical protein
MGAVQGKLATGYQDQITKTLAERIANPDLASHEVKALQALQDIWTNTDLSKKDRVEAVSKTLLYVPPSLQNALGRKAGNFGSKNWFGYATDDDIRRLYGSYSDPNFKIDTATSNFKDGTFAADEQEDQLASDRLATGKGTDADKAAEAKRLSDYAAVIKKMNEDNNNDNDNNQNGGSVTTGESTVQEVKDFKKDFEEAGGTWASGGRAKGGLIKKRKKKK